MIDKERIKKFIFENTYFHLFLLLAILFFYSYSYFYDFLKMDFLGGWDGAGHYAINKEYSDNIFPHLFGWTNKWYAGMPWPNGYPPLFTYTMAILDRLLPFSFLHIFQYLFVFLTFLFPCLVYFLGRKMGYNKIGALAAGIFSIFFLISRGDFAGVLGVTIGATFENGLYPQFFTAIIFLLWLIYFLDSWENKKHFWLSLFLLGLIYIGNIHIAETAGVIFVVYVLLKIGENGVSKVVKRYFWYFLFSVGLASFWLIPLFSLSEYFPTRTIGNVPLGNGLISIAVAVILSCPAAYYAVRNKMQSFVVIFLSAVAIFVVAVFPFQNFFPGLPLQPFRLLPVSYFLFFLLAPLGIKAILGWFKFGFWLNILAIILIFLPIVYWFPPLKGMFGGIYNITNEEKKMLDFMHGLGDGRFTIEMRQDKIPIKYFLNNSQPTNFILSALGAIDGVSSNIWGIFRESSLNSAFAQPFRNAFSYQQESFGVDCWLCDEAKNQRGFRSWEFYEQSMEKHLTRAELLGVRYFFVRTDQILDKIFSGGVKELKMVSVFRPWVVFALDKPIPMAEGLTKEPVLIFTDLKSKNRPAAGDNAYDWLRLNEEWFFHADFDEVFALAKNDKLDQSDDLRNFKTAVVVEYEYDKLDEAKKQLKEFVSNGNSLLLRKVIDPLFYALIEDPGLQGKIFVWDATGDIRYDMKSLLSFLDNKNSPINKKVEVNNLVVGDDKISFSLSDNSRTGQNNWVYLKYSYFPWWKEINGGEVYMASPEFMLVKTAGKDSVLKFFVLNRSTVFGGLISFAALAIILYNIVNSKKFREDETDKK